MSNLFKQYNTVEPDKTVRMIDYNSIVEQKLAELAKRQSAKAEDGEFRGLGAIAEELEREDPEEVLGRARKRADELIKKANEKSESILALAKEQSEDILKKAQEDGYKEGYDKGYQQIGGELESEYEKRKEELEQLEQKRKEDYDRELLSLEPKLLDVILTVVEKVFHVQFMDKKEILLYLVGNAIANIEGCKNFRLRVGEERKDFLEYHRDTILDRVGHDISIEIVSDHTLEASQCMIETDTGIFDCSLGVQLENLIKDLRSLSL